MAMNFDDEIIAKAAEQLRQAIDDDLFADMLVACGWTKIKYSPVMPRERGYEIKEWIHSSCHGTVKSLNGNWLFEDSRDATLYILRWV
jgi:hypothetical protein